MYFKPIETLNSLQTIVMKTFFKLFSIKLIQSHLFFCQCKNCFLSKFLNIQCQKRQRPKTFYFVFLIKSRNVNQIKLQISIDKRSTLPEYQRPQHCWGLLAHKVHFALHLLYHPVKFVTTHDRVDGYLSRNVYGLGFL